MGSTSGAVQQAPGIDQHVRERRSRLPAHAGELSARPWGLALSGGGIRSATFCFGLLKSLAANGLFHRFDLMSTVSGGGYIGSTVGKLFQERVGSPALDPLEVERALAEAETRTFAAWLRSNGRYLIPGGAKDVVFAAASFGRNLLGIHLELALLSILLGVALVGLDLLVWQWADCIFTERACWRPAWFDGEVLRSASRWPTVWVLLPAVAWIGAVLACAYWATRSRSDRSLARQRALTALFALAGIVILLRHSTRWLDGLVPKLTGELDVPVGLVALLTGFLVAWILGIVTAIGYERRGSGADWVRNRLTSALSVVLGGAMLIGGLGVADYLAWSLGNADAAKQGTLGGLLVLLAVALRAVMPKIADLPKGLAPTSRQVALGTLNVVGLLLLAFVVVFWMSWVHRATSGVLFSQTPASLKFGPAYEWLAWMFVPPLVMVALSAGNREFLNRSSLFAFYRARLVRSYLGAANPSRFRNDGDPAQACVASVRARTPLASVEQVWTNDDLDMGQYAPHAAGGPVHLINVCVNETRNPTGKLFNQDRKGRLLVVGPKGQMSTGVQGWSSPAPEGRLTLGSWMAISGAAVAPGLGASTRSGISAVLMLAGLRLGYWWNSRGLGAAAGGRPRAKVLKYGQFLSELRGRFDGIEREDWYLSDGGHFENTGAYALLREECELIVVADCGADPRYSFGDLENLVRTARIDLQADITFLRPKQPHPALPAAYGSLNELASPDSQACLAMARIDYRHSGKKGIMVIVKPNMCHGLAVDLVNFKADNPLFPQEPTTDQLFSEAQWESYFQLGQAIGANVRLEQLADAATFADTYLCDDDGAIVVQDASGAKTVQYSSKRLSSRVASTGMVSASVSLGAVTSIGLAAWQAVDSRLQSKTLAARIEPAAYKELTDIFGRLPPPESAASAVSDTRLGEMATALLRIGDAVCSPTNLAAFRESELVRLMVSRTKAACRLTRSPHASCEALLDDDRLSPCLQDTPRTSCIPMYWTRDYATATLNAANCWDSERSRGPGGAIETVVVPRPPSPSILPTPVSVTGVASAPASAPDVRPTPALPASAPAAPAPPVAAASEPPAPPCGGQTIYIQTYGPELRDLDRLLRQPWRALGASVPPIENVWDSARRAGRRLPTPYSVTTVIFHHASSEPCARRLQPSGAQPDWQVQPLSKGLDGRPGVIEVWLAPISRSAQSLPEAAVCYQEDDLVPGPQRFGVHCHPTEAACKSARGDNRKRLQSACATTDLRSASYMTFSRGWAGSWYAMQAVPFGAPFPQPPQAPGDNARAP